MHKLLEFLIGKRHWILFFLLEIVSCMLLYHNHAYQRNLMLSSSSTIVGHILSISGSAKSYMGLREENNVLFEQNGQLELQVMELQQEIERLRAQTLSYDSLFTDSDTLPYHYITAEIVNNRIAGLSNYITINKGSRHGVKPDMGVVSTRGIVGVVSTVSEHFSVVIPLLNPKLRISSRLQRGSFYGSLSWDGRDTRHAYLEELPRHAVFEEGDTVVTSGYSAVFPPGVIIGTVAEFDEKRDYTFYSLKVKLATDFMTLKAVRVIRNDYQQERLEVEKEARKND